MLIDFFRPGFSSFFIVHERKNSASLQSNGAVLSKQQPSARMFLFLSHNFHHFFFEKTIASNFLNPTWQILFFTSIFYFLERWPTIPQRRSRFRRRRICPYWRRRLPNVSETQVCLDNIFSQKINIWKQTVFISPTNKMTKIFKYNDPHLHKS